MRRIGVISDTHGLLRREVAQILQECDAILHAGDIDGQSVLDELRKCGRLYVVRGNADKAWAEGLPQELTVELFGINFYMVHNKKDVSAAADEADIVVYGHSHKYDEREQDGKIWLNPGSCGKRRFTLPITMAVIEVGEDGTCRIQRKDIAGEKAVSVSGSAGDRAEIVRMAVKEFDKGSPMEHIAKKCGISMELTEQICRMYATHPGIDVDGILNRIT